LIVMVLPRSRLLYIVAMLVSGVVIGLIASGNPALREAAVPPVTWPLGLSLLFDLVIGQAVVRGKAEPLTMNDRAIGVIGAGLIISIILAL